MTQNTKAKHQGPPPHAPRPQCSGKDRAKTVHSTMTCVGNAAYARGGGGTLPLPYWCATVMQRPSFNTTSSP